MPSIFTKILNKEIPADIVYEDNHCLAFKDINPLAPVHVLLIPKKEITTLQDVQASDAQLMGLMITKIPEIAQIMGIDERGYRVIVNCKEGQEVPHLHFHILGGKAFKSATTKM